MVCFLQAYVLVTKENVKFWPILAIMWLLCENVCTFWCTFSGLTIVMVYKKWQISKHSFSNCIVTCIFILIPNSFWLRISQESVFRDFRMRRTVFRRRGGASIHWLGSDNSWCWRRSKLRIAKTLRQSIRNLGCWYSSERYKQTAKLSKILFLIH